MRTKIIRYRGASFNWVLKRIKAWSRFSNSVTFHTINARAASVITYLIRVCMRLDNGKMVTFDFLSKRNNKDRIKFYRSKGMKVQAKKALGQHFLKDKTIANKIAGLVKDNAETVIEIGPGMGVLTQPLLDRFGERLHVVEIDRESVEYLEINFPDLR